MVCLKHDGNPSIRCEEWQCLFSSTFSSSVCCCSVPVWFRMWLCFRCVPWAAFWAGVCTVAGIGVLAATKQEACLARMYPQSAGFYGALGATVALVFANLGSAYGAAKSGVGVAHLGLSAPEKIMRGIVPVVMAGILGIYGLIVAVIINNNIKTEPNSYSIFSGNLHLGAGMAAGLAALAAGLSIGVVGDTAVRAYGKQDQVFVAMVLMLIFSEALGLYGLIIALLMNNQANRYGALCAAE